MNSIYLKKSRDKKSNFPLLDIDQIAEKPFKEMSLSTFVDDDPFYSKVIEPDDIDTTNEEEL